MRHLPLLLTLAACATSPSIAPDQGDPDDTDAVVPDDTDAVDTDVADTDVADTDVADTDAPDTDAVDTDPPDSDTAVDDVDPGVPPSEPVRFIALGDAGEGNDDQYAVGAAIAAVCALEGCDFAVYLGDNFYDDGVHAVDDAQFQSKFELPYAALDFPFYVVLGNHDFGEIPVQFWRTDFQVDYTAMSDKWTMPSHHYAFEAGNAAFFALDTNAIMLSLDQGAQKRWIRRQLVTHASKTWRLAFGHHPWKSNGEHGNAGNYEGAFFDVTGVVRGAEVLSYFDRELCGEIDLYLSGHDHNRQWIAAGARCGVDLIVSGAGSKTTGFVHRDTNPTLWEDDGTEGFAWIELDGNTATIRFYDKTGHLDHEGVITK